MNYEDNELLLFTSSNSRYGATSLFGLFFITLLCVSVYFVIDAIVTGEYKGIPIWGSFILFYVYLLKTSFTLYRFKDLHITVDNEKVSISNRGETNLVSWKEAFTVKNSSAMQTYSLFDSKKKLLFILEYNFPEFSKLQLIISEKIINPNRSISDIITPVEPTEEELLEAKQKAIRSRMSSILLGVYVVSSLYCFITFGKGYEFNGPFIFFPYIFPVFLIPTFLLVNADSSYSSRNIITKVVISLLLSGMLSLFTGGYVAAIDSTLGNQSTFVLSGIIAQKGSGNQNLFTISESELDRDVVLEVPQSIFDSYKQGDQFEIEMVKGSLGILYKKESQR